MQAIFAFMQSKESNFNIGKQDIDVAFARDLNSMEVQDKEVLAIQGKESKKLFHDNYTQKGIEIKLSESEKVNEVTTKAIITSELRRM